MRVNVVWKCSGASEVTQVTRLRCEFGVSTEYCMSHGPQGAEQKPYGFQGEFLEACMVLFLQLG